MDETGKKKLWEDYADTKSPEIREKIILEYAPLVKVGACTWVIMWNTTIL